MDDIDIASEGELDFVVRAIEANRKPVRKVTARGKCYNCDEPVEGEKLFCSADCREDFEFRIKRVKNYQVFEGAR